MPPLCSSSLLLTTIDSPGQGTFLPRPPPIADQDISPRPEFSSSMPSSPPRPRVASGDSATSLPPDLLPPHSPPSPPGRLLQQHQLLRRRFSSSDSKSVRRSSDSNVPSSELHTIENNDPQPAGWHSSSSNRRRCVSLNSALEQNNNNDDIRGGGERGKSTRAATTAGREDELERQLAQSIKRYGECHPATSRLFNQVGNGHFRRGDFTRAAGCYERAARCCESEQQHIAWLNLGTVYWRTGQVDTAIDYLKRARQHCRRRRDAASGGEAEPVHNNNNNNSNEAIQASVYHQLGLCYALRQDYPRSIQALHKAYEIRVQQHGTTHHTSIAQTLNAMGKVHLMMGEYDAAIHCHGWALTIVTASASSLSSSSTATHPYQQQPATTTTRATMDSLRNLAAVFRAAGRSSDLLETLLEQLRLLGSSPSDHPTTVEEQQLRAEIARLQNELACC